MPRAVLKIVLAGCTALSFPAIAAAEYPERPITFIMGFNPGAGADVIARSYQPYLEKCLGQSVVIVNKPGAGGALGAAELKEAAPDGYTIGSTHMPNTVAQAIERGNPPPWESFDYIANVSESRSALHVSTKSQFKTFQEFADYAKANPRVITLGLGGFGNDDHLTQLQAMKATGLEITLVPMGDAAAARAALLGGHITALSASAYEVVPYKDDIHTLWVAAEERNSFQPDVPTLRELGYDVIGGSNQIVGAPKGIPAEALSKLRTCYQQALTDPEFVAEAKKRGFPIKHKSGEEVDAYVHDQWPKLEELWKTNPWAAK